MLLQLLFASFATLGIVFLACILTYGGVWGVARLLRETIRNLELRVETLEKWAARGNGRAAREAVVERQTKEERIADELANRALRERARPAAVRVDEDGLVIASPDQVRRARAEADATAKKAG